MVGDARSRGREEEVNEVLMWQSPCPSCPLSMFAAIRGQEALPHHPADPIRPRSL